MTEPSIANLRKASTAIYIAVEKIVADDISNLFKWAANEIERLSKPAWECMGRRQSLPEPGECNWPDCGCDAYATKVIESLLEQGWTGPPATCPLIDGPLTRKAE